MKSPRRLAAAVLRRSLLPFVWNRNRLPLLYWLHMLEGPCGPELTMMERFFVGTDTAIDIGANCGLFTYRLSRRFRHVHSFEINAEVSRPIAKYSRPNITLHSCGLSSQPGTARFYVPIFKGLVLTGWGSLNRDNLPGAQDFIELSVQLKRLDDFGISKVDFIKIDVEGHEIEVLKGGANTIQRSRPVVVIEAKDDHVRTVKLWFEKLGFRQIRLDCLFQLKEANDNHLFVPEEKLAQLQLGNCQVEPVLVSETA